MLDMEKNYKLAGYIWSFVKVDKNHAVIQPHWVTAGPWPGFKMLKFGGKVDDFYATDIDGEDISAYDDKMLALYDALKDVEDKSASYGKGLYLVSKEKAGFTEWGEPGSGNYWQILKEAAEDAQSFGSPDYYAWLGTVSGSSYAWCVNSNGNVYSYGGQDNGDYVVAPAFNLDLSKVEVAGDEIVIKKESAGQLENQSNSTPYRSIWEYGMDLTKDGKTFHLDPEMVRNVSDAVKEADGRKFVATYTSRELSREQYIAVCDAMRDYFDSYGELGYFIIRRVLGEGFNKR